MPGEGRCLCGEGTLGARVERASPWVAGNSRGGRQRLPKAEDGMAAAIEIPCFATSPMLMKQQKRCYNPGPVIFPTLRRSVQPFRVDRRSSNLKPSS
jgi:hypothetical protein